MAGWCHGTAGHVWLWTAAHLALRDDSWARLAERAAWDVCATPQPTANLCCGLAGQAYALVLERGSEQSEARPSMAGTACVAEARSRCPSVAAESRNPR